jgi:acetylornithine deacetylase
MVNESAVLATLADLVRINSINPAYENGNPEAEIVEYIAGFFTEYGIENWRQEVAPGRPNLIARLPGRQAGRRVVLEAHTDTVSVTGMTIPPFDPVVRDGCLYGRGSCDTKAGLAAMMHALTSLKEDGVTPPCEVWLAAAADEEFSFRGVVKLCEGLAADAAIVAEPTELRAVIASKGVLRWVIRTVGTAAHSSKPHLGVNAISHMTRVVQALECHNGTLANLPHPLLGPATLNVGLIRGGVQVNFVPDRCEIEIDRRLLPEERAEQVLADYRVMLDRLGASIHRFRVEMDPPALSDEAFQTAADAQVVQVAGSVLAELGLNAEPCGAPYGSDASKLSRQGVPSIIFGPGNIDRAHGAVEYVECDQVALAAEFYRQFLLQFE